MRNGYEQIKVTVHIEGDADDETLRELVNQSRRRSAVYDVLTNPTPVTVDVVTTSSPERTPWRPAGPPSRPPSTDRKVMTTIDTVVIGAGHAGLAVSRLLTGAGRDHVVLDRGRVGERWRTERWDSLHLLTPSWLTRLPHWQYAGPTPSPTRPAVTSSDTSRRTPRRTALPWSATRPCWRLTAGRGTSTGTTASSQTGARGQPGTSSSRPGRTARHTSRPAWV